jgi:hypothetical protein
MRVTFDKYSLIINGRRVFIRSGSFHYFRLPSKTLWEDRLQKIKRAGLNCVDFYFPWNYHSVKENTYDFSGIRDVDYLMSLAEELGLYIIARPGPYICAEIDGGGFPGWLLAKKNVVLRCRENGKFKYSPEYIKYVRQWYEEIIPKITKHKHVILCQIENEYAVPLIPKKFRVLLIGLRASFPPHLLSLNYSSGKKYFKTLIEIVKNLDIKVPTFHNEPPELWGLSLNKTQAKGIVDIIATDDYSVSGEDWKNSSSLLIRKRFFPLDRLEKTLRPLNPQSPLFITELQGGWFDGWGGRGYETFRKNMGPEHIDIVTRTALAQGVTLFNYYLFCGGTNWGYLGSPDVYTSCDYGAPVKEDGSVESRYEAVRAITKFIKENEKDLCQTEIDKTVQSNNKRLLYKARVNLKTNTHFIFLRNLTSKNQKTKLSIGNKKIVLKPFTMPIFVFKKESKKPVIYESYTSYPEKLSQGRPKKQPLENWKCADASPQIAPKFNDSSWQKIKPNQALDFDSLGFHYGYVWYRGKFRGRAKKIILDARHCTTVWLNGKFLTSFDNIQNLKDGYDFSKLKKISLSKNLCKQNENTLVILVESLGHKKNFEDDAKQPRGIVKVEIPGKKILWKVQGGLINGESGLTPKVDFNRLEKNFVWEKVNLPHQWQKEGVILYKTTFNPNLSKGDESIGMVVTQALDKANLYLQGYLLGRYWENLGPQNKFYLPEDLLTKNKNTVYIAVLRRGKKGKLGKVHLETYA